MRIRLSKGAARALTVGAITALFALLPAILPYGGRFITRGDYLEQQIAFLLESRNVLLSGGGYSPATFLGAGAVGAYSFYTLGSVFVWPLLLLPEGLLLYGVSVMAVIKHAVAALCAYLYLRRMRVGERAALLGAVMYAFSSFTLINEQFYHFTDVIALFPLLPLALEDAAGTGRHRGALALACGINALTNYYFYVSTALFAALYFVVRFASADWKGARSVRFVVSVLFECACGSLLAGVLLVPSAVAALSFTRAQGVNAFALTRLYKPSDFLERVRALLTPIESGVEHAYYADAASWASVAAFVPVFGAAAFIPSKKRRSTGVLLGILCLSSLYPATNALFSGGTSIVYARWWYALCLMLALGAAHALETASLRALRIAGASALACITLLTLPFLLPESVLPAALAGFVAARAGGEAQRMLRVLSLCMLALHYGLYFLLVTPRLRMTRAATAALCVAAAVHFAAFLAVNDAVLPAGGVVQGEALSTQALAQRVLTCLDTRTEDRAYTCRVDSDGSVRNFGLLRNQMSVSAFHSLRSGYLSPFVDAAGFGYDESPTVAPGDRSGGVRTFLSVKEYYAFDADAKAPEGFTLRGVEDGLYVYENEHFLPMGFFYPAYTVRGEQPLDAERIAGTLLSAVVLEPGAQEKYKGTLSHMTQMLPWQEAADVRRQSACTDFVMTTRGFTASVQAQTPGLVFFTVPYDKSFTAYVDGERATIERANLSFMAVYVEAGAHEIKFVFRTRGLWLGVLASVLSALTLTGYVLLAARRAKQVKERAWN